MKGESTSAAQRIKRYIAEHLREPITAMDIARAAGYSQYHAARVFKGETGLTPFEYIRRERLTASARALRGGHLRVLDVALDYVFDSHEGFTRAFTRGFDMIDLPPCKLLVFQGEPYKDEDFQEAVGLCMDRIAAFNPEVYGYRYAPELAPRMQLSPQGWRGYIEMMPVISIK